MSKKKKATFIHPYDDPDVIAGQGTIGMEIIEALEENEHLNQHSFEKGFISNK